MKTFHIIVGIVFVAVFILHVLRLVYSWDVTIETTQIPMWASYIGLVISGVLAFISFSLLKD